MKISVHAGMKSTKRGMIQHKIPKRTQLWSNQIWNPISKPFLDSAIRENSNLIPETKKYSMHKNRGNYIYQNIEVKEKL